MKYVLIAVFVSLGEYSSSSSKQIGYFENIEQCKEAEKQLKDDTYDGLLRTVTSCIKVDIINR